MSIAIQNVTSELKKDVYRISEIIDLYKKYEYKATISLEIIIPSIFKLSSENLDDGSNISAYISTSLLILSFLHRSLLFLSFY